MKYLIEHNISIARFWAKYYWYQGFMVICPHMNSAHFDGICDDKRFLNGYLETIRRMTNKDILVTIPGWSTSEGSIAEHALGVERRLTIIYEGEIA